VVVDEAVEIDPLTRLAIKHGTDKWGFHFYTPVYHELFSHLRERPIRLLEIGIGGYIFQNIGGASLAMWAEYFPNGRIVGLDVEEKRMDYGPRVKLIKGSQTDGELLQRMCAEHGPFDIIIDDGSHVPRDVVATFMALFIGMADKGLYVIEDVQTTYFPQFGGSPVDGGLTMRLARSILEEINHAEIKGVDPSRKFRNTARCLRAMRAYHNILVFEKGDNDEPSSQGYRVDNPHAARAIKAIEQQLESEPTPEGIANLVTIHTKISEFAKAHALLGDALRRWPRNATLLNAAYALALSARDQRRSVELLQRLFELEPDNAVLAQILAKARSELGGA
jgi:hypothetical protein